MVLQAVLLWGTFAYMTSDFSKKFSLTDSCYGAVDSVTSDKRNVFWSVQAGHRLRRCEIGARQDSFL